MLGNNAHQCGEEDLLMVTEEDGKEVSMIFKNGLDLSLAVEEQARKE